MVARYWEALVSPLPTAWHPIHMFFVVVREASRVLGFHNRASDSACFRTLPYRRCRQNFETQLLDVSRFQRPRLPLPGSRVQAGL